MWFCDTFLYHSGTLLVKQGTFLYEAWPDLAEKRDVFNTWFWTCEGIWHWNLLIGELLVTNEYGTLNFSDSEIVVDGSNVRRS